MAVYDSTWPTQGADNLIRVRSIIIFGMSIEQFEYWSLTLGVAGLIIFMVLIIWRMARDSRAGRLGYAILFLVLGLGIFAFAAKSLVMEFLAP